MKTFKRRLEELEKKHGSGEVFCLLVLKDGDPDSPENHDPNVFTMILDMRQDRKPGVQSNA
jgi:hypothetical protein